MATTREFNVLAEVTLFSGGSTANLAGSTGVLGAAVTNLQSNTNLPGYPYGKFRFSGTFAAAPAVSTALTIYFVKGDSTGSTYETASVLSPPPGLGVTIPLDSTNTTQTRDSPFVTIPPGYWKPILYNGTAQQISAGWSLTLEPATDQGV